jgi:hypothetical protein
MLEHSALTSNLDYNAMTGVFTWKLATSNSVRVGGVAGSKTKKGYSAIRILGNYCLAHRLAWFYVHGCWPDGQIDHINGNPVDNRISNLRVVSNSVNAENKRRPITGNTSGLLGVSWMAGAKKWRAQICVKNEVVYLGLFEDKYEAHKAYLSAKRSFHTGCTI